MVPQLESEPGQFPVGGPASVVPKDFEHPGAQEAARGLAAHLPIGVTGFGQLKQFGRFGLG